MHPAVGRLLRATEIGPDGRVQATATNRTAFVVTGGHVLTALHNLNGHGQQGWMLRLPSPPASSIDIPVDVRDTDRPLDVALLAICALHDVNYRERLALGLRTRVDRYDAVTTEGYPVSANSGGLSFSGRVTDPAARLSTATALQLQLAELSAGVPHEPGGQSGGPVLTVDLRTGEEVAVGIVRSYPAVAASEIRRYARGGTLFASRIQDVAERFPDIAMAVREQERGSRRLLVADVARPEPGAVARAELLENILATLTHETADGSGTVLLRGLGGAGKTYLARQVVHDERTIEHFRGQVHFEYVGHQIGDISQILARLSARIGPTTEPALVVLDDVWSNLVLRDLRGALPATTTVLATSRGVRLTGATEIEVGGMTDPECLLLLRGPEASPDDAVFGDVARHLHRWPLLLHIAAQHIYRFAAMGSSGPAVERARSLLHDLERDPTELADTSGALGVIVRRSVDLLDPVIRRRFLDLAVYQEGAELGPAELSALWDVGQSGAEQVMLRLEGVGLAEIDAADAIRLRLHDLIVGWLHDPDRLADRQNHATALHRRCVEACDLDAPTPDQLQQLAWHIRHTGRPDDVLIVLDARARSAFLTAFGSQLEYANAVRSVLDHQMVTDPAATERFVRLVLTSSLVNSQDLGLPWQAECARLLMGSPEQARSRLREFDADRAWQIVRGLDQAGRLDEDLIRAYLAAVELLPAVRRIFHWLSLASARSPAAMAHGHVLIRRAFNDLDEVPNDEFQRFNLGVRLIEVLGRYDFADAWRRAGALPNRIRALGAQLELVALVPARAAALIAELTVEESDLEEILIYRPYIEALSWSDLEAALAVAGRKPIWRDSALRTVMEAHALVDAAIARTVCEQITDRMERCRARCHLALQVPPDEVDALLDAAAADLEAARYHGQAGPLESQRDAVVAIAEAMTRTSVAHAIEFADGLALPAGRCEALAAVALRIMDRQPDQARALLDLVVRDGAELTAPAAGALSYLAAALVVLDPPAGEHLAWMVTDHLLALEGRARWEELTAAKEVAVPVLAAVLPELTARFVRSIRDGGLPDEGALEEFLAALPHDLAWLGVETVAWFPHSSRRSPEVALARLLARQDPDLASQFVSHVVAEDARDWARDEVAHGAALGDPLACPRLVNAILDQRRRSRAAMNVAAAVALRDPAAARALVLSHVEPDRRAEIFALVAIVLVESDPRSARAFAEDALAILADSAPHASSTNVARALSGVVLQRGRLRLEPPARRKVLSADTDSQPHVPPRKWLVTDIAPVLPAPVADSMRGVLREAGVTTVSAIAESDVRGTSDLVDDLGSRYLHEQCRSAKELGRRAASATPDERRRFVRHCTVYPVLAFPFLAGYLDGLPTTDREDRRSVAGAVGTTLDDLTAPQSRLDTPDWTLGESRPHQRDAEYLARFDALVAAVQANRAAQARLRPLARAWNQMWRRRT